MPDYPADEHLAADLAIAEETLIETGALMPSFVVMAPGKRLLVPVPAEDPQTKTTYYELMRLLCHAENAFAITQIAEVWMRRERIGDGESLDDCVDRAHRTRLSQAPDCLEGIIAATCRRNGVRQVHLALGLRLIVRDKDGKPTGTVPAPISEGSIPYDVALAQMLPTGPLSAGRQERARRQLTQAHAESGIYLRPTVLPDSP